MEQITDQRSIKGRLLFALKNLTVDTSNTFADEKNIFN